MRNWDNSNFSLLVFLYGIGEVLIGELGLDLIPKDKNTLQTPRSLDKEEMSAVMNLFRGLKIGAKQVGDRVEVPASEIFPLEWYNPKKSAVENGFLQKYINCLIAFLLHYQLLEREDLDWEFDGKETFTLTEPLDGRDADIIREYITGVGFEDVSVQQKGKWTIKVRNYLMFYTRDDSSNQVLAG